MITRHFGDSLSINIHTQGVPAADEHRVYTAMSIPLPERSETAQRTHHSHRIVSSLWGNICGGTFVGEHLWGNICVCIVGTFVWEYLCIGGTFVWEYLWLLHWGNIVCIGGTFVCISGIFVCIRGTYVCTEVLREYLYIWGNDFFVA